jgi:hypothetical protein
MHGRIVSVRSLRGDVIEYGQDGGEEGRVIGRAVDTSGQRGVMLSDAGIPVW